MRRLGPFLLAAIMACFPPSILIVFIGGLASQTAGPPRSCTHHGACGVGDDVVVTGGRGAGGSGFVTGVAYAAHHTAYVSPSHYPMVATTASIVASTMTVNSGGKAVKFVQPVSADWTEQQQTTGGGSGSSAPGLKLHDLHPIQDQPNLHGQGVISTRTLQEAVSLANDIASSLRSSTGSPGSIPSPGGEKVAAEAPPDTLKVSVLGASRGKSSDCTYSLVEFSNTHHSDAIIVYSTYIEPTAVFPPDMGPSTTINETPSSPYSRREYYEDRQLHVPPRTAVTIPVSIIPHMRNPPDLDFHHYQHAHYRKLDPEEDSLSSQPLPIGQDDWSLADVIDSMNVTRKQRRPIHADLLDMAENIQKEGSNTYLLDTDHRSKLLDSSTVHETLVANTSWGFVQMKVPYTCSPEHSKEYEFGLPNNLMFLDGGGGWYARFNTTPSVELAYLFGDWEFNPTRDVSDPFIYRVYMNNPLPDKTIRIWDVFTTKPDLVAVEMQLRYDTSTNFHSPQTNVSMHFPLNSPSFEPKENNRYVVTLRLNPHNFTSNMTYSIQDLGFLEIHTNIGKFSIALDYVPNGGRGGVIHGVGENKTTLNTVHLVQDHVVDKFFSRGVTNSRLKKNAPKMTITKSYHAKDAELDTSNEAGLKYLGKVKGAKLKDVMDEKNDGSLLRATPPRINFGSITTGSRSIKIPLKLGTIHQSALRVMRISVAMSTISDNGAGNVTDIIGEDLKMEIGVDFSDGKSMILLNADGDNASGDDAKNGDCGCDNNNCGCQNNACNNGCNVPDTKKMGKKETFTFSQEIVLPPTNSGSIYEYPLHVWCRFYAVSPDDAPSDPRKSQPVEVDKDTIRTAEPDDILHKARFYTGAIIIRASEDLKLPYSDWERKLLLEHTAGGWKRTSSVISPHSLTLTIPISGSVLPGNLGSPTESLLFPTHFFVLPVEERVKIMTRQKSSTSSKIPDYYERQLDLTNNFAVPLSIVAMKILDPNGDDSFCKQRFSTVIGRVNDRLPVAEPGKKWHTVYVRYHFHDDDDHYYGGDRKCLLSIETDRAGKQSLPLIIYTGELVVDMERPDGGQRTVHCLVTKKDGTTVVSKSGMPCVNDWIAATPEGKVLKKAILNMQLDLFNRVGTFRKVGRKTCSGSHNLALLSHTSEMDPVESYFRSLLSTSKLTGDEAEHQALQPTVLHFGAIPTGRSVTRSILLTNLNHAPIEVTATSSSVGNTSIQIGLVPVTSGSLHDVFSGMLIKHGSENKEINELAYFLQHSDESKSFFQKFKSKFDISPSPRAHGSELLSLFQQQAIIDAFDNATEYLIDYVGEEEVAMDCTRGFMLAVDGSTGDDSQGTYKRQIKSRKVGKKKWTIPPGGVARFLVAVRAPERDELQKDITPFVGSGLVLETNHGQAMPIVLTYSAISGSLQLRPDDMSDAELEENRRKQYLRTSEYVKRQNEVSVLWQPTAHAFADVPIEVPVPLTFKDVTLTRSVDAYAQSNGVSLSIESTFSQDLFLSEIRSCNKWFNVFLPSNNAAAQNFFSKQGSNAYLRIKGKMKAGSEGYLLGPPSQEYTEHSSNKTVLPLGKVLSALSCSHPSGDTSFYACALAWLENRDAIQPPGCGLSEMEISNVVGLKGSTRTTLVERMAKAKANAIGALRDVVAFLSVRYADSTDKDAAGSPKTSTGSDSSSGGYIHFSRIHMFDHALKMWKEISSWQMNRITGHINAKAAHFPGLNFSAVEFPNAQVAQVNIETNGQVVTPLQMPVSSILLMSKLEVPKLFKGNTERDSQGNNVGIVEFGTVHVADVATRYVSLSNPTAMTVRLRLAAIDSLDGSFGNDDFSQKNVFVQGSPEATHTWWTGGSYWMSDSDGKLISASHNVTIKSGAGAYVSLLNPALHTMNAFVLGCGKRCGLRGDQDSTGEEKQYSSLGAASSSGTELFGRSHDQSASSQQTEKKSPKKALGIDDPPSFSLGRIGNEVILPPYGTAKLGPVYFRPPGKGSYKGTIYIENSLTGFEKVELRGRGGWENLVFLDPLPDSGESWAGDGGNVEFRFGKSALVFPGSKSKEGAGGRLEKAYGGPVVKSVRLKNTGDVSVDISRIYMASSEVMHFTHKRRHPSLLAEGSPRGKVQDNSRKCQERGFVLPGCMDPSSTSWIDDFIIWFSSKLDSFLGLFTHSPQPLDQQEQSKRKKYAEEAELFYKNGFTLQPNQTQTMFVLHYPDCTFQTSYASIIFEIGGRTNQAHTSGNGRVGSWQQTFKKRKVELLVGYDMSTSEYRQCIPYAPPENSMSIWEQKIVFHIPVLLQDLLSFGLTRLKDGNGNPYIPRRPIEVTLLAASFVLLLFALSLDLICTVEISAIRKSSPSWKPTCRCLARADPTSSDLVSIGKEQTKHVLLSRFKKESAVLPSHCVHSDGSLSRERVGLKGRSGSSGTHSEAIFDCLNLANESKTTQEEDEDENSLGVLPCGLGWRTAMRRGIGLPLSPKNGASELQYLTRTRDRYVKKQRERQQRELAKKSAPHSTTPAVAHLALPTTRASSAPSSRAPQVGANYYGNSPSVATAAKSSRMATPTLGSGQANFQTKERKVEKQTSEQVKNTLQTSISSSNGKNGTTPTSRPAPQSKPSDVTSTISLKTSNSNANKGVSENRAKSSSPSFDKAGRTVKVKNSDMASSYVIVGPTDQKSIKTVTGSTKGGKQKQQQRNEVKTAKTDRVTRTETKKDVSKQEDSSPKPGKQTASQKQSRSAKLPIAENTLSGSNSKGKQEEKGLDVIVNIASPSRKEHSTSQTKQGRQTKKGANGTKSTEQQQKSGKQGKQKAASKKATAKTTTRTLAPTEKSSTTKKQAQPEFSPLSSPTPQSPIPNSSPQQSTPARSYQNKGNIPRPPPGLLAPPGFLDQPDFEGPPTPGSLSMPSPQRSLSGKSPAIPPSMPPTTSSGMSGLDAIQSAPMNNDLMTLIGMGTSNDNPILESSLFQEIDNSSPRAASDGALSIPPFRPQSFSPPVLEPPLTSEMNHIEHPPSDVQALLGAGSNFNVSNFLDGILSDSTHVQAPVIEQKPAPQAPKPAPFQSNIIGVSLDPWNSADNSTENNNNNQSNPLAVLQGAVASHHQESPVIAGIPLNSNSNAPSLLASSSTANTTYAEPAYASLVVSDDGRDDDDFLEPDSFYNNLLGED